MSDTPRTDGVLECYDAARAIMLEKLAKELERELEAAKAKLKEAYYDLLNIATMLAYDQDDCHRLRNLGRKAASNIQPFLKP